MNELLKQQRLDKGKTQAQLAKELGMCVQVYQRYEFAGRYPNVAVAIRIADALNVKDVRKLFPLPKNTHTIDGNKNAF